MGIELVLNISSSGLTFEEEESFLMKYNAEFASNRVLLCENEIDKIKKYIDPEYLEEWKPPRLVEKLGWWKQMLEKAEAQDKINADRLKRENEATKDNEETVKKLNKAKIKNKKYNKKFKEIAKEKDEIDKELKVAQPLLEKHSHIGKGPRRHELLLDEQIDLFDQGLTERNEGVQQPSGKVLIRFKQYLKEKKEELKKKIDIEEIEDEYDCLKWRYPDGRTGKPTPWIGFPQRLKRIRDRRNK